MSLTRRSLITGSAALAGAAAMGGSARAQAASRKLLIVLASGGWDPTYALDPKPGSSVVDAPAGTVQEFSGIPVLTDAARPSVSDFFTRYGERTAVVNGVQVRSFVHADCMKRILTGTANDQNADFGALAAFDTGRELPVPYLVLGMSAMSGPLASITSRAGTTNQLSSLLLPSAADPFLPAAALAPSDADDTLVRQYLDAAAAREQALRGMHASTARQIDSFTQSLDRSDLLRRFAKERGGFGARGYTPDLMVQVDVAVSALQGDLCQVAMLELPNWDTHQNNAQQGPMHEALYAALVHLADSLDENALLERTAVVVLSEMGRTPKLNSAMGKDHWPVTSCLVFGAGVAGGKTIGASDGAQNALGVNLATGAVEEGGTQLQTANLAGGLLSLVGVDPAQHFAGVEPLNALVA
ncbi:MAG TPA: DUF1501 domain-containing protein [Polyangiaceae bacterium]|nr:DUF1501 domain-containing protein [Polyangiaceae bacterium]